MKCLIDLSKDNFYRIDFTEANIIDLYCQHKLPTEMEFKVWGATLLLSPNWNHTEKFSYDFLQSTADMYVAGSGLIRIENLVGGNIEVFAYDNIKDKNGLINTAKNSDGSELVFRREWNFERTHEVDEYVWECVISWPYGFCNLHLFSKSGKVSYEFNSEDMVNANEYLNNPQLYTFNESRG